jgi:N-acetylglucosamine transport system permease protein
MNKTIEKRIFIFVCTVPALILLTIFMIIPTIQVFRMSLFKWGGFSNNKVFVGLDNFKILWNDMNFFQALQNFQNDDFDYDSNGPAQYHSRHLIQLPGILE